MTKRSIDKLQPGDKLRIKRGYDGAGDHVTFLEQACYVATGRTGRRCMYIVVRHDDGREVVAPSDRFTA